MKVIPEMPHAH